MKDKFPFVHIIKYDTKEVLINCQSAITAMGISSLVNKYYPGYTGKIASKEYLEKLKNQLVN